MPFAHASVGSGWWRCSAGGNPILTLVIYAVLASYSGRNRSYYALLWICEMIGVCVKRQLYRRNDIFDYSVRIYKSYQGLYWWNEKLLLITIPFVFYEHHLHYTLHFSSFIYLTHHSSYFKQFINGLFFIFYVTYAIRPSYGVHQMPRVCHARSILTQNCNLHSV